MNEAETRAELIDPALKAGGLGRQPGTPRDRLSQPRRALVSGIVASSSAPSRCAATNVDPATGARDLNIPRTLMQTLGHADGGISPR